MNSRAPPTAMHVALTVAADHPAFAGHFPRFPLVPGVVLLDEALHAIEAARELDLCEWQIASAKFLDIVRPGDPLTLEHTAAANGTIRFTMHVGERTVATGTLSALHAA